jgi:hypothetical protein
MPAALAGPCPGNVGLLPAARRVGDRYPPRHQSARDTAPPGDATWLTQERAAGRRGGVERLLLHFKAAWHIKVVRDEQQRLPDRHPVPPLDLPKDLAIRCRPSPPSVWHPDADLMTRNNLNDHLPWLLQHASASKFSIPAYPSAGSATSSRTVTAHADLHVDAAVTRSVRESHGRQTPQPDVRVPLQPTHGPTTTYSDIEEDLAEITADDWNMGRLTSASKSNKPSLLSRVDQLPILEQPTPSKSRRREAASGKRRLIG